VQLVWQVPVGGITAVTGDETKIFAANHGSRGFRDGGRWLSPHILPDHVRRPAIPSACGWMLGATPGR
jgi:hypothetical protein